MEVVEKKIWFCKQKRVAISVNWIGNSLFA